MRSAGVFVVASCALVAGCSYMPWSDSSDAGARAQAAMQPTQGHSAKGVVEFTQRGDDVAVAASLTGLAPGEHGFHIHEKGDCSAPDATSAGGHFNPTGKPHGNARLNATIRGASLRGGATNLIGRAVVVHANRDDFRSQPAGDSGARVACGVIASK